MKANVHLLFKPESITARSVEFNCLGIYFSIAGMMDLRGYKPNGEKQQTAAPLQREVIWSKINQYAEMLGGDGQLKIEVTLQGAVVKLDMLDAQLRIMGENLAYKGVRVRDIDLLARVHNQKVQLQGKLSMRRGELTLRGGWRMKDTHAKLHYKSNVDLVLLKDALPEQIQQFVRQVDFRTLPVNEGTVELDWQSEFTYLLRSKSLWQNFYVLGSEIEYLSIGVSFDGTRLLVSDAVLRNKTGECEFSFLLDGDGRVKGKLKSDINPTSIKGIFGEGAQPFFNSLDFQSGPVVKCKAEGASLKFDDIRLEGTIAAQDFSYKKVFFSELQTPFVFKAGEIDAPQLFVRRPEGTATGSVRHNFRTKQVDLKDLKSELKVREISPVFGSAMMRYSAPYRFYNAPKAEVNGHLDLDGGKTTNLIINLNSKDGMDYEFLGATLKPKDIDIRLHFKGQNLTVQTLEPLTLFQGKLNGSIDLDLKTSKTKFTSKLDFLGQDFGDFMYAFFANEDVSGTLNGSINLNGILDSLDTLSGWGDITVLEGVLYPIPIFGSFSEVLNKIVPNLGYSKASRCRSDFVIKDGIWETDKIEIYSTAFALIGNGTYNIPKDDISLDMRVNIRGLAGVAFYAFSKFFEYEGTGSLQDTTWEPKNI
ncbi:MAG: AsmA-like C-terminal region-containing protein, partial [Verrucomicrobiota bacterium]